MIERLNKLLQVWWTADSDDVAQRVFSVVEQIAGDDDARKTENLTHLSLYENRPYSGLDFDDYFQPITRAGPGLTYKSTKSIIDTLVARITKNRPLPKFHTSDGDWSDQQRAQKLNRFVEGQFNTLGAYEYTRQAFRDACIFGTGLIKVQRLNDRLEMMRVLPHHLLVPHEEAYLGEPRQMHHRMRIHTEVLARLFPRKRESIVELGRRTSASAGMVEVIESWHLASDPHDPKDGRRTLCIEGLCLVDEPYTSNRFPFAIIHYDRPMLGFWGMGLVAFNLEMQTALNEMTGLVADSIRLTARPIVVVKRDSKIASQKFDNKPGAIFEVEDTNDIKYLTTDAVPPSAIAQRNELKEEIYRQSGVSSLSAQSKKPSGLDSAVALREFGDIEADRFAVQQQQYEELILDIARHLIRLSREAHDAGIDLETKSVSKQFFKSIKWSQVDLDDDKYVMRVDPVSQLPRTSAGKLERVQELLKDGLIDRKYALQLIDIPDLERVVSIQQSKLDDLYDTFDRMLEGGEYDPPEPFQDLQQGIDLARALYLKNKDRAPPEVLENLRMWIADAIAMMPPPPPMPPAEEGEGSGAPPAPGGAPPLPPPA